MPPLSTPPPSQDSQSLGHFVSTASFLTHSQPTASRASIANVPAKSPVSSTLLNPMRISQSSLASSLCSIQYNLPFTFWNTLFFWIPEFHILLIFFLAFWLLLWQLVCLCLTSKCWSFSELGLRPSCSFPAPLYDFICSKTPLTLKALIPPRLCCWAPDLLGQPPTEHTSLHLS